MLRSSGLAMLGLMVLVAVARADKIELVAGGGRGGDGTEAAQAQLIQPFGVDFSDDGKTIFLVEMAKGERLRAIGPDGRLVTWAGSAGVQGNAGDGGPGSKATFNGMHSLATGPQGQIFLADTWNHRVRVYSIATGQVEAFAGTGKKGFAGDGGPADKAQFGGVFCVSCDPARKYLYITDLDNKRIRKVDLQSKIVTTVAGNGHKGIPQDGQDATQQPLVDPRAHAVDRDGNVWILERAGHALRVVDRTGKIRTVAGTEKAGMGVGKAREAALNGPKHLCLDRDGTILIADTENHRIVRFNPNDNTLTRVAGTGQRGQSLGQGDPQRAEFNRPHGVSVHPTTGDIYIVDSDNNRIVKITRGP
ncbi:MAG: hypothetical protein RMJ56_05675 [Gemmataceae bacterium]|nr:hypothetical protein [Gemmata sp.]MDW8197078.1 hypothetical protein [Gemmataceae bacterium]